MYKGYARLWKLRRPNKLGASSSISLDIYQKHIRNLLEYADPIWGPMISEENCEEIERVKKCSYAIILDIIPMIIH